MCQVDPLSFRLALLFIVIVLPFTTIPAALGFLAWRTRTPRYAKIAALAAALAAMVAFFTLSLARGDDPFSAPELAARFLPLPVATSALVWWVVAREPRWIQAGLVGSVVVALYGVLTLIVITFQPSECV